MKQIHNLQSTAQAIKAMSIRIKVDDEWLNTTKKGLFLLPELRTKVMRDKAIRERALERLKMRYNNQLDKLNTTRYENS